MTEYPDKLIEAVNEAVEYCHYRKLHGYKNPKSVVRNIEVAISQAGYAIVPVEPTGEMWGGLARDIVFWTRLDGQPTGAKLYEFLRSLGRDIPDWLLKEIPDVDHVPPKGTVAVVIFKAMLSAYKGEGERG